MKTKIILNTDFPKLKLLKKGKVRDIYEVGDYYLIVSTDRLSAFDVIFNQGIPFKGRVLNQISAFWFQFVQDIIPNHLVSININDFPAPCKEYYYDLEGRSMLVKKAAVIPIEAIVRGYISGSAWEDYNKTGRISGVQMPQGLIESQKFPNPLFTPSTKAEVGLHDENISISEAEKYIDKKNLKKMQDSAISIYEKASAYAKNKGIIIADTKMEFGFHNDELILVDEVLTPDCSRFWQSGKYQAGHSQESYDKQFVRDYLVSINFNKQPPPPQLPEEIISRTSDKYLEALFRLTGITIA